MKRLFFPLAALALLTLSGCGLSRGIYSNYRAIEELQLVRTLGLDADGGALVLSAAAARAQDGGAPVIARCAATGIPQGLDALQLRVPRGQLYFAHTQYIALGEDYAARGVGDALDFVERDIHTRLGASLFVVRDGTAEALLTGSGEGWDVGDVLTEVLAETSRRGDCCVFDARETAVDLSEYGAALICALRLKDTQDSVFGLPPGLTAVPDGYGILRGGALVGWLDGADARAASFVRGKLGTVTLAVPAGGGTVTVELSAPPPEIELVSAEGGIVLSLSAAPEAVIVGQTETKPDTRSLAAALDAQLREALERVLERARAENCDFLALTRALRTQGVAPAALPPDWLRTLDARVTVHTTVRPGYDMDARAGTDGGGAA